MVQWHWSPPTESRSSEYYQSLDSAIKWYRAQTLQHLFHVANAMFEEDCRLVLQMCRLPPRTHDDIVEIRRTLYAMLSRRKYVDIVDGIPVTFFIMTNGEVIFEGLVKETIVERYARRLIAITPDEEYLIRKIAEQSNVVFRAGLVKL
jgi:hypothetical protein